jgi:type I restriction enzyme S subunit
MTEIDAPACLGDYVDLQRGNTYKGSLLGQPGPVLLGLASIARNGGFRSDNLKTYGGQSDPRMLLRSGDVYVSLKDVTQSADLLGAVSRVPNNIHEGRLTQDTVKLVFKENDASKGYIYWLLRTPIYREYCRAHATGTTNLGLPREDFLAFPIPALTASRAELVAFLQALEDKIDLNRRMNATLEAMARAIFKDWFVDFGPIRAKMEGRAPYLTPEIWKLFPDRLDDQGKPEGWSYTTVERLMELAYGKALPANERKAGSVPVYGSGGITGFHTDSLVNGPSVIVGRKGTVGSLYWEHRPSFPIDTVFYLRSSLPLVYCYHLLETQGLRDMNTDAAVPGLNRANVYRLIVPQVPDVLIQMFGDHANLFRRKMASNLEEINSLTATRDLLLPKLISGDIRVKDAEKIAVTAL